MPEQPNEIDHDAPTASEVDPTTPPSADVPAAPEDEPAADVEAGPEDEPAPAPEPLAPRKLRLVALVALVALVIDQATKSWAVSALSDGHVIDLVGSLRFNLTYNTGVAFSQGSGKGLGPWISLLALVVVVIVALGTTSRQTDGALAAGLISGGALGNLGDRAFRGGDGFLHGGVIDFIDLQWWPIFNVADAAVVVGAGLLVVASLRAPA